MLSGILLVVTSAGLGAHIGAFAGRNHIMVWAILGLPYLVAGVLPDELRLDMPRAVWLELDHDLENTGGYAREQ